MAGSKHITVFEHEGIWAQKGECRLSESQLKALQSFYGSAGVPYYSLIHKGVKFSSYVGVLQIGSTVFEILPKPDKLNEEGDDIWRKRLIDMLQAVGVFNVQAPSSSALRIKHNSILDLYFALFVKELNYLLQRGLIKKYRKTKGNKKALVGALQFSKHLQKNLIHKERFYVRHSVYDQQHDLHCILYKALKLLAQINTQSVLTSSINRLLLDFPEMPDIKVTEGVFEKIHYNRKTIVYQNAIEISRLLLLNYHPDISKGQNNVLALLFDMNVLWEQFVYVSLKKQFEKKNLGFTITAQTSKYFWKPTKGSRSSMRPDIVINEGRSDAVVLDTKWKNLVGRNPSPDDLRQMYVYHQYYQAKKVGLVHPGASDDLISGTYYLEGDESPGFKECSLVCIACDGEIWEWQGRILLRIFEWMGKAYS